MQNKSPTDLAELDELLTELERRKKYRKIDYMFPDSGPLSREHYPKQIQFFAAGKQYKQRAIIAGNRSGKTVALMTEATYHATGDYPHWWTGHRFKHPVIMWLLGKTNESTKNILQYELLGPATDPGSGLIPKERILNVINRPGSPGAVMTIRVEHRTNGIVDGVSEIGFQSYEQGREALQGTALNFVGIDEEPRDYQLYEECYTRTIKCRICSDMDCQGRIACSFTPFFGVSEVVRGFLPGGRFPEGNVHPETGKWVCQMNFMDAPHFSQEVKDEYVAGIDPWMKRVRLEGLPNFGSGQIYPVAPEDITVAPFKIPDHWPRAYGMDVGWEKTAVVWMAQNPDDLTWYVYSEYYAGRTEAPIHVEAIKSKGAWIPGVIDPASNRTRDDGSRLLNQYLDLGLDLRMANNAIEAGLSLCWQMLSCGQVKVFTSCKNFLMEQSMYHKDENGKIPDRQLDHLLDAWRYLVMSGLNLAVCDPGITDDEDDYYNSDRRYLGADEETGY